MFLLISFSGLSLVMACLGIYSDPGLQCGTSQTGDRHPSGARSQFGPGDAACDVAWDETGGRRWPVMGVAAAAVGGRLLRSSLYEVQPFDPVTLGCSVRFADRSRLAGMLDTLATGGHVADAGAAVMIFIRGGSTTGCRQASDLTPLSRDVHVQNIPVSTLDNCHNSGVVCSYH
jgi:hypothetical protein